MISDTKTVAFSEVPKGRLLIWLLIAGEIVIFGGAIVSYLLARFRFLEIYNSLSSLTSVPYGAFNTVVLLTSSYFIVMAHHYAHQKKLEAMQLSMWITVILGGVFLIVKTAEWVPKLSSGITMGIDGELAVLMGPGASFWDYYYFLTGMHALHVILGMVAILLVMYNVRDGKHLHRVEMAGVYWHFVDIVWIFLFPLFYLSR